jgi:prophage maintenance system killer protein
MTIEVPKKMVHYLTVQDVLWINQEVTKESLAFKYAQLEEGTNYQYGYGKSENVLLQAGQFIQGFIRLRPFASGNRATAFISALAFLRINGYEIELDPADAREWVMAVADRKVSGKDAIAKIAKRSDKPVEMNPPIRTIVKELLETYSETIENLRD